MYFFAISGLLNFLKFDISTMKDNVLVNEFSFYNKKIFSWFLSMFNYNNPIIMFFYIKGIEFYLDIKCDKSVYNKIKFIDYEKKLKNYQLIEYLIKYG